jgi:hypothetical protein
MIKKFLILVAADPENELAPTRLNLLGEGIAVDLPDPPHIAGDEIAVNGKRLVITKIGQRSAYTHRHGSVLNITAACAEIHETGKEYWSPGTKPETQAQIEPGI